MGRRMPSSLPDRCGATNFRLSNTRSRLIAYHALRTSAEGSQRGPLRFGSKVVYAATFGLGQSEDVILDVTGVLRLRVVFTAPYLVGGAVGDPVATG